MIILLSNQSLNTLFNRSPGYPSNKKKKAPTKLMELHLSTQFFQKKIILIKFGEYVLIDTLIKTIITFSDLFEHPFISGFPIKSVTFNQTKKPFLQRTFLTCFIFLIELLSGHDLGGTG